MGSRGRAGLALVGLAVTALLACNTGPTDSATPRSEPTPTPPSAVVPPEPVRWAELLPADAPDRAHAELPGLDRVPGLTDDHRERLREHGLFITPQPEPSTTLAGQARAGRRATHLFQVYERNDYVRFPSYVTVDLAIDLTHRYFDSALRRVEQEHLSPMLAEALRGYVKRAVAMRDEAKTDQARKAAAAAAGYWATALRLLEQPARGDAPDHFEARPETRPETRAEARPPPPPPPAPSITRFEPALERDVVATVATVHAAKGTERFEGWGQRLDLTLTTPRGHYTGSGVLQRYFRAMSWLGRSTFPVTGERARPAVLLALALCTDSTDGSDPRPTAAFEGVLAVTNAVVGQPPTVGLTDAARIARKVAPQGELDGLLEPATLAAIVDEWKRLPAHPTEPEPGPVVQPIGGRVLADTAAMAALLPVPSELLPVPSELPPDREPLVRHAMGAAGSAAMLGSDLAREAILATAGQPRARIEAAIADGRDRLAVATTRDDAYHRTLAVLSQVLRAEPYYFDPRAHHARMLGTFAGGWVQLRHDTLLLHATPVGAGCDAQEPTSPYGFVEPYPELYAGLRAMVQGFEARLHEVGISSDSIATKTEVVASLLQRLEGWSRKELRGEPFTEDERTDIAMVGGSAEHALWTLADAHERGEGNDDMAVIADVLTLGGQTLEVGVAHPELLYAVIPTPEGWRLARGAVLAYREFLVPADQRLTDEAWRARVAASPELGASARPPWLAEIVTAPVGVVGLPADGRPQSRCEHHGGAFAL